MLRSEGGLINDETRRRAWPKLLGITLADENDKSWKDSIVPHKDTDQIERDIERSLYHFDVNKTIRKAFRSVKRDELSRIINAVICRNPHLNYYQGFHDICSVLLLVGGEQLGFHLTERVALFYVRDAMNPSFDQGITQTLELIPLILQECDPQVHSVLETSQTPLYFSLPWILTWFSHRLQTFSVITRLFDFFMASHPLMPVYMSVAVILYLREGILKLDSELSSVHHFFQQLPDDLPVEELCTEALRLYRMLPPLKLIRHHRVKIDSSSPLFTFPFPWMNNYTEGFRSTSTVIQKARKRHLRGSSLPAAIMEKAARKYDASVLANVKQHLRRALSEGLAVGSLAAIVAAVSYFSFQS